jgi:hypothetical protein
MLVSDVMADVYNDVRQVLNTSTDASIYIPWVNRIQHDVLHTSLFNYLIQGIMTVSVVNGTSVYTMGTPVRRITMVYDRTFDRILQDVDDIAAAPKQDATSDPNPQGTVSSTMLTAETMTQWPLYYRRVGNTSLYIFPAPQKSAFNGTYEIHYEGYVPDVANTTDTLTVPNDGRDLMVAGVNSYAMQYLKLYDEAASWKANYEAMKNGIAQK